MKGIIDPHVHLRDGIQSEKETLAHGLKTAEQAGFAGVFEMPNTNPPLTSEEAIFGRIAKADHEKSRQNLKIFHGIYGGVTVHPRQISEIVRIYNNLFPRVVGLKMFAGTSTGDLAIISREEQQRVYEVLTKEGYRGVLAVHCEREDLFHPEIWDPSTPLSHSKARPPEAEQESVKDQINFAGKAGFQGILHVCHLSHPGTLKIIEEARDTCEFKITCGVTPHHALLSTEDQENLDEKEGMLLKVNPPLRNREEKNAIFVALLEGRIDWIESDHAPHTLADKLEEHASGLPGFPGYLFLIQRLKAAGIEGKLLEKLTSGKVLEVFGLVPHIEGLRVEPGRRKGYREIAGEYPWDPYDVLL